MKKNGFTLVELLAVIVILGIISTIVVPQVTGYIEKSKRAAFVQMANSYVDSVNASIVSNVFDAPVDANDVTIVNVDMIELDKEVVNSPYGSPWVIQKSYVAVINEGTKVDPKYAYYFAGQDEDRNAIPLTKISDITEKSVTNEARNTMEVTVQSLAGNIAGNDSTKGIISGLDNIKDSKGNKQDWNVKIYTNRK